MIHPDQLQKLGKLYHEEALQAAQRRHLGHLAKAHRSPRSEEQGLWSRLGKLAAAAVGLS
jgi:hypothetical protein